MEGHGGEPSEMVIGFVPSDPSIIFSQIQKMNLTNKTMGFEAVVNATEQGPTPEMQELVNQGLYQLIISQINPTNKKILGLIVTSLRRLSVVFPDHFRAVMGELPIQFLLSVPDNTEVIDFLEQTSFNFPEFGQLLLSTGPLLLGAVGTWLQASNVDLARCTLELLGTLAQFEGAPFDFNCVRPFVDASFPTELRGLALNVLILVDKENYPTYLELLMTMFMNDAITGIVVQVLRDAYTDNPEVFAPHIANIYMRLCQIIEIPEAAILLADIIEHVPQEGRENAITLICSQPELTIERVDAIYRICGSCGIALPPPMVVRLAAELATNEDEEVLGCLEQILMQYPAYFAEEDGQAKLFDTIQNRAPIFSKYAFRLCIACCMGCPVAPPLLEAVRGLAEQCEADMDPEMHEAVAAFLAQHTPQ